MKRVGDLIQFENNTTDMPPMVASFGSMRWNKTGSWRYIRPLYEEKAPPCTRAARPTSGFRSTSLW